MVPNKTKQESERNKRKDEEGQRRGHGKRIGEEDREKKQAARTGNKDGEQKTGKGNKDRQKNHQNLLYVLRKYEQDHRGDGAWLRHQM